MVLGEPFREPGEFGVHLVERNPLFQTAENGGRRIVRPRVFARHERKLIVERYPEFFRDREFKILRHHADDGGRLAVYPDRLADDVWITAEIAFPNFVAEDRRLLRARLVIVRREITTDDRRDVDDSEKIFGYVAAGITLRIVLIADV